MSARRWHPPLDAEDLELWERVKAEVRPLRPPRPALRRATPAQEPLREASQPAATLPQPPPPRPAPAPPDPARGLDEPLRRKLRRGAAAATARLDLHGLRQSEAHARLGGFLRAAQAQGHRVVLVITGKGAEAGESGRGVLRRLVPLWLGLPELRGLVVAFGQAEPGQGGAGALYVQLRRPR